MIPVVYKEFDFKKDSPIQISRKNSIPFQDWAAGLSQLIKKLEADRVPRKDEPSNSLLAWKSAYTRTNEVVEKKPELLQSNWFGLTLPETLSFFEITGINTFSELSSLLSTFSCPAREYLRLVSGFGSLEEYQRELSDQNILTPRAVERVDDLLKGKGKDIHSPASESKKILSSLVRKAWDNFACSKGLIPYKQADGQFVWWFPQELTKDEIY